MKKNKSNEFEVIKEFMLMHLF